MTQKKSRVVLITGACGGIGRATVQLFSSKGWHVLGVDRSPFGDDFPENGYFIQADITDPRAIDKKYLNSFE